jgi:hypothetical protein
MVSFFSKNGGVDRFYKYEGVCLTTWRILVFLYYQHIRVSDIFQIHVLHSQICFFYMGLWLKKGMKILGKEKIKRDWMPSTNEELLEHSCISLFN